MKKTKLNLTTILTASAIVMLQACHTHPETPEPDPIFAEKKRPQYNQVLLNQKPSENEYQEVNASFVSDYQARKNANNPEILVAANVQESSSDAIQRLKNEATKYNYKLVPMQEYTAPAETIAPQEPEERYIAPVNNVQEVRPVPVATGEAFEIQAGAYQSEAGAMKVVQKLESRGVQNTRIDNHEGRYTIRINNNGKPFGTRESASKTLQEIIEKTQHYDIMVVKN